MSNFKVYKSSAGSGKTFTLVKEYLKLCLQAEGPFGFSKILAITFTNKASQEMKERILLALDEMSYEREIQGTSFHLKKVLVEELALKEEDLAFKCKKILTSILHNYADFNVSTIDKFSHKLIRTFAKDLGLNINFSVDLETQDLLKKVVGTVISLVGVEDDISKLIIEHVKKNVQEGKSWKPANDLLWVSESILKDDGDLRLKEIKNLKIDDLIAFKKGFYEKDKVYENKLKDLSNEALVLIDQKDLADKFSQPGKGLPKYFSYVAEFNYSKLVPTSFARKTIEEDKWTSGKATEEDKFDIEAIKGRLTEIYLEIQSIVEQEHKMFLTRRLVAKNLNLIALLKHISIRFEKLKKIKGLLPISDFNKKIAEVVLTEPMPFIYERLGERYDHIMIDEFQDTSVMQFMNLVPLVEESLARGKFNMIVGDAKQAIYRFRGGEVEQFSEMPDYLPLDYADNNLVIERLVNLKGHFKQDQLDFNFRSDEKIVEFNNLFFENVKQFLPERIQNIFKKHEQEIANKNGKGYVKIEFLSREDYDDTTSEIALQTIEECLNDGFLYKDIAIICRFKSEAVKVSEYLKSNDIPLLSSESLLLSEYPEVQLLISLGRWVLNPENRGAQKDIIAFLKNDDFQEQANAFQQYIRNKKDIQDFLKLEGYQVDLNQLQSKTVYEIFESLIQLFNLNQDFNVYVQFFQEAVFNYSSTESSSLQDFLDWWEEKSFKLSISVPEGLNTVQVLTVHKSKGLEFPVVIYPFADQSETPKVTDFIWVDSTKVQAELKNVLIEYKNEVADSIFMDEFSVEKERKIMDLMNDSYVAFTRASNRLYVSCKEPSKSSKSETVSLSKLLIKALPQDNLNDLLFEYGKPSKRNSTIESVDSDYKLKYYSEPWSSKIKMSLDSHKKWEEDSTSEARHFGNLFHEIMALINSFKDIEPVLKRYFFKGRITKQEEKELAAQIQRVVEQEECQVFFNKGNNTKSEATLLLSNGEILRPDRVVYFENRVVVLDYKTGEQNEAHQKQIYNYMNRISETTQLPVEGFLYYLDDFKLVKVA